MAMPPRYLDAALGLPILANASICAWSYAILQASPLDINQLSTTSMNMSIFDEKDLNNRQHPQSKLYRRGMIFFFYTLHSSMNFIFLRNILSRIKVGD